MMPRGEQISSMRGEFSRLGIVRASPVKTAWTGPGPVILTRATDYVHETDARKKQAFSQCKRISLKKKRKVEKLSAKKP